MVDAARVVPVEIAKAVFAAYGVGIPCATRLRGGLSDHAGTGRFRQYSQLLAAAVRKHSLECAHQGCPGGSPAASGLRRATRIWQRRSSEIATDWISAYKKYFRTQAPLPEHASFLKDRPWE